MLSEVFWLPVSWTHDIIMLSVYMTDFINPYWFGANYPITLQLHPNGGGLWWADSNGALYKDGNYLVNVPFSSTWCWI